MKKVDYDVMSNSTEQIDSKNEVLFDEKIEGYGSTCGESDAAYRCKKDCIFVHNALISAVE